MAAAGIAALLAVGDAMPSSVAAHATNRLLLLLFETMRRQCVLQKCGQGTEHRVTVAAKPALHYCSCCGVGCWPSG
jgi:hypothetical protein